MFVEQFACLLAFPEVDVNVPDFISEFRIIPARTASNCLTFQELFFFVRKGYFFSFLLALAN